MSDYTPIDLHIREAYQHHRWMVSGILDPYSSDEFERWFRKVKAEAWDEGAEEVNECHGCMNYSDFPNPYRQNGEAT